MKKMEAQELLQMVAMLEEMKKKGVDVTDPTAMAAALEKMQEEEPATDPDAWMYLTHDMHIEGSEFPVRTAEECEREEYFAQIVMDEGAETPEWGFQKPREDLTADIYEPNGMLYAYLNAYARYAPYTEANRWLKYFRDRAEELGCLEIFEKTWKEEKDRMEHPEGETKSEDDALQEAWDEIFDAPAETRTPVTPTVKPVEELTKEDFENPDTYKMLTDLAPIDRTAYEVQLKAKAAAIGKETSKLCKDFLTALKRQEATEKRQAKDAARAAEGGQLGPGYTEYRTLPDGYKNIPIPRTFIAGDSGIYVVTEDRNGELKSTQISDTPALVTQSVDDGKRVVVLHEQKHKWKSDVIPIDMLETPSEVKNLIKLFGFKLAARQYADVADFFTKMIKYNECSLPTIPAQPGLGWDKKQKHFCLGPGEGYALSTPEGTDEIVAGLQPVGSYEKWLDTTRKLRALGVVSVQYPLAASFAAPLVALEGKGITSPVVNIWGDPGTGKSFGARVAMTVWGDIEAMETSLKMSQAGKETALGFVRNLPRLFDDSNNLTDKEMEGLPSMIYDLANGEGTQKARVTETGEIGLRKLVKWKLCILVTSEQPINEQKAQKYKGGEHRVTLVPGPDEPYLPAAEFQRLDKEVYSRHYGWAGREYIKEIERLVNTPDAKDPTRSQYDVLSAQARKEIDAAVEASGKMVGGRVRGAATLMYLADKLSDKYIFKDGKHMTAADYVKYMRDDREIDQTARIIEELTGATVTKKKKFTEDATKDPDGRWGVIKDGVAWYTRKAFDAMIQDGGGARAQVIKKLRAQKMLVEKEGVDPTKPVTFRVDKTSTSRGFGIILPDLGPAINDLPPAKPSRKVVTMPGQPEDAKFAWAREPGYMGPITSWEEIKEEPKTEQKVEQKTEQKAAGAEQLTLEQVQREATKTEPKVMTEEERQKFNTTARAEGFMQIPAPGSLPFE